MFIPIDNISNCGQQSGSTASWTHLVGGGDSRVLFIFLMYRAYLSGIVSITVDGSNATFLDQYTSPTYYRSIAVYYVINPSPGSKTVEIALSQAPTHQWTACAISLYSVHQTYPSRIGVGLSGRSPEARKYETTFAGSATHSIDNKMLYNDLCLDIIANWYDSTLLKGVNQTELYSKVTSNGINTKVCKSSVSSQSYSITGSSPISSTQLSIPIRHVLEKVYAPVVNADMIGYTTYGNTVQTGDPYLIGTLDILGTKYAYSMYIRFPSIVAVQGAGVPRGSLFLIQNGGAGTGTVSVQVYGYAVDNAPQITNNTQWNAMISNKTTVYKNLDIVVPRDSFNFYIELDISTIIEEIFSRPGWVSGNAIGLALLINTPGGSQLYDSINNLGPRIFLITSSGNTADSWNHRPSLLKEYEGWGEFDTSCGLEYIIHDMHDKLGLEG